MLLTIGAWYNEPGINFEFSYRISNFIREAIKESVMEPLGLLEAFPEKHLAVTVTTTSTQDQLEVKMGRNTKTTLDCGLWFPYNAIMSSENPLEAYVDNYIASIPLVFARWNVTEEQINEVTRKIKAEIIGNSHYLLTEEEQQELDEEKQWQKEMQEKRNL